jgi:hypothetical protein
MNAPRKRTEARRARSLAGALACLFAGAALYANSIDEGTRITQDPSGSNGNPTLDVAVAAVTADGYENADGDAQAPREAKTAIAWTRPWGNKS